MGRNYKSHIPVAAGLVYRLEDYIDEKGFGCYLGVSYLWVETYIIRNSSKNQAW